MAPRGPRYKTIGLAYNPKGQIVPTEGGKYSDHLNEIFQYYYDLGVEDFWSTMRQTLVPMDGKTDVAIRHGVFSD